MQGDKTMKEKILRILVRALHTFCQTAVGMIGTEQIGLFDVNWKSILSVCTMSAIVSILKSIAIGMPETETTSCVLYGVDDEMWSIGTEGTQDGTQVHFEGGENE